MAVQIRLAKQDDLSFVQSCAIAAYSKYIERMGKEPAPMIADFESSISKRQIEIVCINNKPIGFVVSFHQKDHLFIENVALHPNGQGKGYTTKVFNHLETKAIGTGIGAMELYTNEKMTENLGLYARLGFQETERRTENGFNRVYFRKDLSTKQ